MEEKRKLPLLQGKKVLDPEALASFWASLTGVEKTPELVKEFRQQLEEELRKKQAG